MSTWQTTWGDLGQLGSHQGYLSNPKKCALTTELDIGSVATFVYDGKPRFVFVLNPNYPDPNNGKYKMHAAALKLLDREIVLKYLIPNLPIAQNPLLFYETIYKPSVYEKDAYRTYLVDKVQQITMFDYDPGASGKALESGMTTVDDLQDFFSHEYGEFAESYRQVDRAAMFELFKQGATYKEVEAYYKGVVLKRYVSKYSDAEFMSRLEKEGL